MANSTGLGYLPRQSPIHRLTGAAKLVMVVCFSVANMLTFDTRFLAASVVISVFLFILSKIKLRELRFVLILILVFMVINNVVIFLFAPEQGVIIYGTRHVIARLFGRYYVTLEQLFYQLNVTIKYFAIVPVALIFFITTEPSEFASSLNRIGVSYKIAFSVSLALRYIPTIQRSFHEISQSQQARGVDLSSKAGLVMRIRGRMAILFPLIFSSLDKIETIANAMELRGFGKHKKRTWYNGRRFTAADYAVMVGSALTPVIALLFNVLNGGRFFNPFI